MSSAGGKTDGTGMGTLPHTSRCPPLRAPPRTGHGQPLRQSWWGRKLQGLGLELLLPEELLTWLDLSRWENFSGLVFLFHSYNSFISIPFVLCSGFSFSQEWKSPWPEK